MRSRPTSLGIISFGSTHGWTPCKDCGVPLDQIGDPANETWDYFAQWMLSRFG